jgi:HD domain-containing protein
MPLVVSVFDLEPGMFLAKSVLQNFNLVLPKGHQLKDNDINFLIRKFPNQMIHVNHAPIEDEIDPEQYAWEEKEIQEISHELQKNLECVASKANSLLRINTSLPLAQLEELQCMIERMLKHIQDNPVTLNILEQSTCWHEYLQKHGMAVFNFSLLLCYGLQDYIYKIQNLPRNPSNDRSFKCLTPLTTAALFHDIGMTPIQHVYDKSDSLNEEDQSAVRAHPAVGVELLPDEVNSMAQEAVFHHHENFDGSGYVEGLKHDEISVFGRILRIADSYAAAISQKPYRNAKPAIAVLHEMIYGEFQHCYDPALLQIFAGGLQPLPIGAKLKLNTGQSGVVVQHDPQSIFQPQIMIAFDEGNSPLPKSMLDPPFHLRERDDIEVISFGKLSLGFINENTQNISVDNFQTRLDEIYTEMFDLTEV